MEGEVLGATKPDESISSRSQPFGSLTLDHPNPSMALGAGKQTWRRDLALFNHSHGSSLRASMPEHAEGWPGAVVSRNRVAVPFDMDSARARDANASRSASGILGKP